MGKQLVGPGKKRVKTWKERRVTFIVSVCLRYSVNEMLMKSFELWKACWTSISEVRSSRFSIQILIQMPSLNL